LNIVAESLLLQVHSLIHCFYPPLAMAPSSTSLALIAGSALLATAAASKYFSSSSKDRSIQELDEDVEVITEDDVCKIFERLFLEMNNVLAQLSQQIQQVQMSGQHIPEAQIRQILKGEFERALMARQGAVFEDFGVDADCLEQAVWEFMADEKEHSKVVKSVERFQKLYENVSGEKVVGRRPGKEVEAEKVQLLDAAQTVEAAQVFFGALTARMKELVEEIQAEGKSLQDPAVAQELNMKFSETGNESGEEALKEIGITMGSFQASIQENIADPTVGRALQMFQMKQQQDLIAMGVPLAPGM
jgi:hypothetical protein